MADNAHMELAFEDLDAASEAFNADAKNLLARNVVTEHGHLAGLVSRPANVAADHQFSHVVDPEGKATNQKSSGRCWLFAACNVMRLKMMEEHGLDNEFELSQTYLFFYDKLEKANYFLENIIATAKTADQDSRLLAELLSAPINDGGQWDMVINLVDKYGVVPKSVFPEAFSSCASRQLNAFLTGKLRQYASRLREIAGGYSDSFADKAAAGNALRDAKTEMMSEVYRILAVHFGEPPREFTWTYRNKDKDFVCVENLTPQSFYADYVPFNCADYVSLIHDPRNEYQRLCTVSYLGNIVGGVPIRYINLPIADLKKYARSEIEAGNAVWFGCDVGKEFHRAKGVLDLDILDTDLLYGTSVTMTKEERLLYGHSQMTHAMVLTGCHSRAPERPVLKWRIENSWGPDKGDKGYLTMTDAWFSEYVFQIIMPKSSLPDDVLAILDQEPLAFPLWDPLGALAE